MIRALDGLDPACAGAEAAFLAAAAAQPLPGVSLGSAWHAFGKNQARGAHGWHFFAAGPDEEPFALALRGGAGWACGRHDADELGDFLRYTHTARFTQRADDAPPQGFAPAERLLGFCLPAPADGLKVQPDGPAATAPDGLSPAADAPQSAAPDDSANAAHGKNAPPCTAVPDAPAALYLPPLPPGCRLVRAQSARQPAAFLLAEGAFGPADAGGAQGGASPAGVQGKAALRQYRSAGSDVPVSPAGTQNMAAPAAAAQSRAAAARFAAELDGRIAADLAGAMLLTGPNQETLAALAVEAAPGASAAYLSALWLHKSLRGQGIGGALALWAAAGAHRQGRALWLLCTAQRAAFYARLGFRAQGDWLCLAPMP